MADTSVSNGQENKSFISTPPQEEEYDVIVLGTGLPESILAAAYSRIGQRVLHIDRNEYYAGEWGTFNLDLISEWAKTHQGELDRSSSANQYDHFMQDNEILFPLSVEDQSYSHVKERIHIPLHPDIARIEEIASDAAKLAIGGDDVIKADQQGETTDSGKAEEKGLVKDVDRDDTKLIKTRDKKEEGTMVTMRDLMKESRRFNIDLRAQLLWSKGDLVELLISSRVGKYLEFRAVEATYLMTNKGLEQVREEFEGKPFVDFMKYHKLSVNVQQFVVYAIAMVQDNVTTEGQTDQLLTEDGLLRTQRFLRSLGTYGKTPFLSPSYGVAELCQAFCRLCAVYGGVYMLRKKAIGLICKREEENNNSLLCNRVLFDDGQVITTKRVVVSPSYFTKECLPTVSEVTRGIYIVNDPLVTTNGNKNANGITMSIIPPGLTNNKQSIEVLQLGPGSQATPTDKYLVHLTCQSVGETPEHDLEPVEKLLFRQDDDDEASSKPRVLYSLLFRQSVASSTVHNQPMNVYMCGGCEKNFDSDEAVRMARSLFNLISPEQ
eukprot:Ihof_evm4s276 gene=Ihof_evmTU4s276